LFLAEIKVGDSIPDVGVATWKEGATFHELGPNIIKTSTHALFSGKKVVLFSIPGAFTPTCTNSHCPGFVNESKALKAAGIDLVAMTAVNDVFVLKAFEDYVKAAGQITFLADGSGHLASSLGLSKDLTQAGLGVRGKRYALVIDNLVVKYVGIDDAGVDKSSAQGILAFLKS